MSMQLLTKPNGEKCNQCKGDLVLHGYKHESKVGRYKVTDGSGMVWHCQKCNAPQLTLDDLQGYQLNAAKTVLCDGHYEGEVVRYARKALGLTQKELGTIIAYQHETISRWESDKEPVPPVAANAIVGVLCRAMGGESPESILEKAIARQEAKRTPRAEHESELVAMPRLRCA